MKTATKAALFNALLFPGWGQLYLKQYKKGIVIMSAITAGIFYILCSIIQSARTILKIAPFKKGTVTFISIIRLAIESIKELNYFQLLPVILFILLLGIISIVDAYQFGAKELAKPNTDVGR